MFRYLIITVILALRSIAKKTVENKLTNKGKQANKQTKNSNSHMQVYIRLDTLKVSREGAWATSGGCLFQTLMVQEKKVFDL